ncbi:uncharacterized protein LOC127853947 [Dreissena polymorpha]|uniref:TNFR-Cys domain-containing protein n=1 Tax=Dreissena polymorpha TaxID=45954 RepID=A0A9D4CM10_DREPO|nr:uncharacterized protein LOC127853947 [Dreissena polymorpha]KAH3726848.1 hypothetical protein DPMN_052720 [Dreissena polymorpha]
MKRVVIVLLICVKIYFSDSARNEIPCGSSSCDNVGYESCVRPPEVRTEADSLCYLCKDLTRYGDPCDPANTRQGCVLYCIDKTVEKIEIIWNQSQESQNRTWQRLIMENENTISLLRENATEQARKMDDANKTIQLYIWRFVATLLILGLTITILSVVLCLYCKKVNYRSVDDSESSLTDSIAYSKIVSDTEEPKSNKEPNSIYSVELTHIMNSDSQVIMQETNPEECRDGRLSNVPPQQDDSGEMCTGSSLT